MYRYKCVFTFNHPDMGQVTRRYSVIYDGDGLFAYTNGFWITKDVKFTKGSDCKYWIPPSQIKYIEKIKGDKSNA